VRDGSLLSLRCEWTTENIRPSPVGGKLRDLSTEIATFPLRCSATSNTPAHFLPPLSQSTQSLSMPVQDRTNEFRACVESIRNRSTISSRNAEQKQRLLPSQVKDSPKSEFTRVASSIAKDINTTTIRLGKLAQRECAVPVHVSSSSTQPDKLPNGRPCSTIVPWKLAYANRTFVGDLSSNDHGYRSSRT